jgi:conjugal transfer pilus assembly protein TraV
MIDARFLLAGLLAGTAGLSGCTSLGGNVKGDFSCKAPDGICAPSSMIDDRALAMISGEDGDRLIQPAGPYAAPPTEGRGYQNAAAPVRTRERVLRIVFPAQIDAAGRLHEQSAVHAVVEQGEWSQALAGNAVASTADQVAAATGGDTLLAAVERAEPPTIAYADPDLPSDAAVAAARIDGAGQGAAVPDPIGDIKDQVARKLTAPRRALSKQSAAPRSAPAITIQEKKPLATAPGAPKPVAEASDPNVVPTSTAPTAPVVASAKPMISVPEHATAAGIAAVASVSANPAISAGLARAEPEARAAAKDANPLPVIGASSFPGVQP